MTYPKSNPVNKHDLIKSLDVSLSRLLPSLSPKEIIEEASNALKAPKAYVNKLSTIYTYDDAPSVPKPMNPKLPILGFCSLSSIGLASSFHPTLEGMTTCMMGVKRADGEYRRRLQEKDKINSGGFAFMCKQLRDNQQSAFFLCPKTKRGGFIVAMGDTTDGCDYAVYCLVASIDDLGRILNQGRNGSNNNPVQAEAETGTWNPEGPSNDTEEWKPSTPPEDDRGSNIEWKPSTPPDDNEWRPSTPKDDNEWKPSTPPDDNEWKPSTPPDDNEWKPSTPPDDNEWKPSTPPDDNEWKPSTPPDSSDNVWRPSTPSDDNDGDANPFSSDNVWRPSTPPEDDNNQFFSPNTDFDGATNDFAQNNDFEGDNGDGTFHTDSGAAAADKFYSGLNRSLGTRADSILYHMRNFNGWIKATQIAELDPITIDSSDSQSKKRKRATRQPLRVLDLACGKGGDLGKWVLHKRGIANYVGVDVARGSLSDAAVRARKMRQLKKCVFTCADLGADVPGRLKSEKHTKMQKLLSWSLKNDNGMVDPEFRRVRGGGISETDKFDVVSIQFAIHYMMSSIERARRFFHTVSQLLEIGGNLIATTIDARVVMEHMMNTGYNFHFDDVDNKNTNEAATKANDERLVVAVGENACQLKFNRNIVKKIFEQDLSGNTALSPNHFGLEYTFTLVEGDDHAAGVGQAVDLPEWLTPLPVLIELAKEAGLRLDYASNFHEFFSHRKDPMAFHAAHGALYNMKVLNRSGTISEQEWEISRMYMAVQFVKERESTLVMYDEVDTKDEEGESEDEEMESATKPAVSKTQIDMNDPKVRSMYVMAMTKAKRSCGDEWQNMTGEERNLKTNEELSKLMS